MRGGGPSGRRVRRGRQAGAAAVTAAERRVATIAELADAVADRDARTIIVTGSLDGVPTLRLSPGQAISGGDQRATLRFRPGQDGLCLTADNTIQSLRLVADPDRYAVFNDTEIERLGRLVLHDLQLVGTARLLAQGSVRSGHIEAHRIDIEAADARNYAERPKGYGVEVIPGAFTLWNRQPDPSVTLSANLSGLSAGRAGAPVRGSGIFVSGAGDAGGCLIVPLLETGAVHSDGGIAPGTPDRITGGVFTVHGAFVDLVRNRGPITTYGANDMVLDNWGTVDRWIADDKITSFGPSGIGFVNFGVVNRLEVNAPIETFGAGARGFNVYTGTVQSALFERVVTQADGAIGIQISQPVGEITMRRGIETFGKIGESLVMGVLLRLPATALSIKPGGSARLIEIEGGLVTHGAGIDPLELRGRVETLRIGGGFTASGGGFEGI
jgi:hypothetical protein